MSHPTASALVREKYAVQQGQQATRGEVIELLQEIVTAIPGCTLIIDGMDECGWCMENQKAIDGDSILTFMEALMRATGDTATRVMIVSRDEPEIRTSLPQNTLGASVFEHKITPQDVQPDVLNYSRKVVYTALTTSEKTAKAKESLSLSMADRSNGQFLWVRLQRDSLCRNNWRSQKELERTINLTPIGLEDVYERNWIKILKLPEEDRDRALSLLRWTAFSL
jgi:hypothetical protein